MCFKPLFDTKHFDLFLLIYYLLILNMAWVKISNSFRNDMHLYIYFCLYSYGDLLVIGHICLILSIKMVREFYIFAQNIANRNFWTCCFVLFCFVMLCYHLPVTNTGLFHPNYGSIVVHCSI